MHHPSVLIELLFKPEANSLESINELLSQARGSVDVP
jgi:hypothetical protein